MTRYYFDYMTDQKECKDYEGVELSKGETLDRELARLMHDLFREEIMRHRTFTLEVHVRNGGGETVAEAAMCWRVQVR